MSGPSYTSTGPMRYNAAMLRACLALALALMPAIASASVPDLFGFGARGVAMGGAVASTASGFEAVYYNPAGLAFDERPSFALGFQRADFFLEIDGSDWEAREAPALVVGFAVPLPFGGALARRIALGMGFVLPQTTILDADIPRPGDRSFVLVETRAQTVSIQGALAVRAFDWLSLGAGFIALAELEGEIDVAPNAAGAIGSRVGDELLASFAVVAGALVRPHEDWSVALTFRDRSAARFDLPITADLGPSFPLPIPPLTVRGTAQFDPRQVYAEVAWSGLPRWTIAAGASWRQWSEFPNPLAYTAVPEGTPPQPAPGFSDTILPRAGVEGRYEVGDVALLPRMGYAFEPSPAPAQEGFHNYLDNDRHQFGGGLGMRWAALRIDLALQWQWLAERRHTKDPAQVDTPDANPGFPSVRHGGHVFLWGLQVGAEL